MCGIAGIFNVDGSPVPATVLRGMTDAIAHRGPDGEGFYTDSFVGLGHRRLAVIDLSPAGHQPMADTAGDHVIVYNGEVYNFQELRVELEAKGYTFRSRTDTEVVLQAYAEWGEAVVEKLNGMFAFAIWDRRRQRLFMARDRYGIKPLYYYVDGKRLIFASEIKAILACPELERRISYEALNEYLSFQNIFSDRTLFEGILLLPPAHTLTLDLGNSHTCTVKRYWDYDFTEDGALTDERETEEELYRLFEQAVQRQLVSDVPVGSYLSGGMDSGSVTALAARHIPRISTFTCGFDLNSASGLELGFDERAKAEAMSWLFKSEHYEVVLKAGDMEAVMPELVWHLEDLRVGQCYPNYYVSRLASKFVKVVLSGAGGDELFGGYPWRYYRAVGSANRDDYLGRYYDYWQRIVSDGERQECFNSETRRHIGDHNPYDAFCDVFNGTPFELNAPEEYVNKSLYFEIKTFLHGLYVVEDKLSMAHSLETRVPFMDNDLVDFAMRIPVRSKIASLDDVVRIDENEPGKLMRYFSRTRDGKLLLRKAMSRLVPREVTELTKQGFSAPDASWFRGESIDYVRDTLMDSRARIFDFLQPGFVHRKLDEHSEGKSNHRLLIWSLLSLEWWCRKFEVNT